MGCEPEGASQMKAAQLRPLVAILKTRSAE
jgi:hypothetical protein